MTIRAQPNGMMTDISDRSTANENKGSTYTHGRLVIDLGISISAGVGQLLPTEDNPCAGLIHHTDT